MSLFARRVETRAVSFQDVWGRGYDDVFVGDLQARALSLAPVYGAVRLIADNLSTIPFHAFRSVGDVSEKLATQPTLLEYPTQHGTVVDWRMRLATSLALRGNAMGYVTSLDGLARPKQIEWLNPADVELDEDDVMVPATWRVLGREVDRARIVHIPLFVLPGKVLGLSPIAAFKQLIEAGLAVEKFGLDWFKNGAIPSGLVTNETGEFVSKTEAEIVKDRFKQAAAGRDVVAMGGGWQYSQITVPPEESQFLQSIKANATTVATIFGVPADRIGGEQGGSLTYNTVAMSGDDLTRFTLRGYLVRIETALSALLPRPIVVRANADALTRPDLMTRYQAHQIALNAGFLSRNEVRRIEDRPPIEGGDKYADPAAKPPARTPSAEGAA